MINPHERAVRPENAPRLLQSLDQLPQLERRRLLRRLAHVMQPMMLPILAPFNNPYTGMTTQEQWRVLTSFFEMSSPGVSCFTTGFLPAGLLRFVPR